jgi:hypothetical protein
MILILLFKNKVASIYSNRDRVNWHRVWHPSARDHLLSWIRENRLIEKRASIALFLYRLWMVNG